MISPSLATFVCLLICLGQLADSNPYNHRQHSFSSRSNSGPNGNSYSGASYQSLGIQAAASHQQPQQSRGNNEQFWWQGSQSPFSETAAKNRGVSAGARAIDTSRAHARPLVPGCGGGKCFGAAAHSVSATAVASSHSNGQHQNALNQHYLPPQASAASFSHGSQANNNNHQSQPNFGGVGASQGQAANVAPFPGCAAAMKCVTEEFCSVDGVMINTPVRLSDYEKEYLRVPLMECTNPETNQVGFCCRDPLYEDPWPADMPMPGMMNKVPAPSGPAPVHRPTVSTSNNVRPPAASSFNNFAANGNRPTVAATAAVSSSSNGRPPVSSVVAGASSFYQTSQAQQPSQSYLPPTPVQTQRPAINLQPAAPAYQPPAPAYQPPAQAYKPTPAPTQRPVQQAVSVQQPSRPAYQPPAPPAFQGSQTQQQTNIAQGPPPPPFAGCAAALKCVTEEFCSVDGVMVNTPVRLSPYEKEYLRVPLMECTNPETNQVGFCCRDPLYEDPWPADMPMPGMMNKVPTGPATTSVNRPVISASAAAVSTSNNARPPVSPFNNFAANGNRPTVTATAAVSSVGNGRPQVAASSFNGQQANPFFIPSSPAPTQRPIAHQPAYQPPSQSYLPPPAQKPTTSHQVTPAQQPARPAYQQQASSGFQPQYQASQSQQTNTIQGPPGPSFAGCAAALKCVKEEFCSVDGVMVNTPVRLSAFEKEYLRVPLMPCLNTENNQEGFCCRDPLYNDPWPAGMPMP
ncbi:inactive serine protease scarface-like [Daphnia pulicaria]|uniref:inactive serine protease scarface-like n=1 Tax=Daphnia pulicaria TaxID=35523 RepID=UPI001EE9F9B1|nr:inactive serine protease scarface-like [Daphnia pulicaria]